MREQAKNVNKHTTLLVPRERVYPVTGDLAKRLAMDVVDSSTPLSGTASPPAAGSVSSSSSVSAPKSQGRKPAAPKASYKAPAVVVDDGSIGSDDSYGDDGDDFD